MAKCNHDGAQVTVSIRQAARLLRKEGVEGVGIGQDDSGRSVIRVYVSEDVEVMRQRLPQTLAGWPIQVVFSGEFEA